MYFFLPQPKPREPFPPLTTRTIHTHTRTHNCSVRPSNLSIDHFQAALGIAVLGAADNIAEQAFLISRSQTENRKFSASVIRKWAESRTATNNRRRGSTSSSSSSSSGLPSKVVADLLRKASANPRSGAAALGTDNNVVNQAPFSISRSRTDRKFSASSEISPWAERKTATTTTTSTNNGKRVGGGTSPSAAAASAAKQPSTGVADLLRKAAALDPRPSTKKSRPCRSHVVPERQVGFGGVPLPPGCGEAGADGVRHGGGGSDVDGDDDAFVAVRPPAAEEEPVAVLGRHFRVVASALLGALCGRDGEGGCNGDTRSSSSSSGGGGGDSRGREPNDNPRSPAEETGETGGAVAMAPLSSTAAEPAAAPYLPSSSSSSSTKSTGAATLLSKTMISPSTTNFRGGASSPLPPSLSSSSSSTAGDEFVSIVSSDDNHRHRPTRQQNHQSQQRRQSRPSEQQHQPKPPEQLAPPPPRLFVGTASLSKLTSRTVNAETECSAVRARLELMTRQLSKIARQARASELESAATGTSELGKVRAKLAAVVLEAAMDKAKLKEVRETGEAGGGGWVLYVGSPYKLYIYINRYIHM